MYSPDSPEKLTLRFKNNPITLFLDEERTKIEKTNVYSVLLDIFEIVAIRNRNDWVVKVPFFKKQNINSHPQKALDEIILDIEFSLQESIAFIECGKLLQDTQYAIDINEKNIHKIRHGFEELSYKFITQREYIMFPTTVFGITLNNLKDYATFLSSVRRQLVKFKHIRFIPYYPNSSIELYCSDDKV